MGELITSQSVLTCPHGGAVAFTPSCTSLLVDGNPTVTVNDAATVTGCPQDDPCTTIQWNFQGGLLVVNPGVELVIFPEASACLTAGGTDAGPPVVQQGLGGAAVGV